MALFLSLYLGHLMADYALQPGALVRAKRESLQGLLLHVGLIGAATALVLWNDVVVQWPLVVMAMGAHFVIEKLTIAARIGTPTRGLFVFLFDQSLHVLSIGLLVWIAGAWTVGGDARLFWMTVSEPTLMAVDGLVTVTLLGSILVFEAAGAFVGDPSHDTTILEWDLPRVLGMAERGVALALAIYAPAAFPGATVALVAAIGLVMPFVPRFAYTATRKDSRERERLLVEGATGLALCVLAYSAYVMVVTVSGA